MRRKVIFIATIIIISLLLIFVVPELVMLMAFKNRKLDFDYREKKNETIQENKEFLEYTFNGEEWKYDSEEKTSMTLPYGEESFYTEYVIRFKNKYGEDKELRISTDRNIDFAKVVYSYAVHDMNNEIKKQIAPDQENIEFTTEITLGENNNWNILDIQTGIKLYDIYEFFGRKANEDNLSIYTKINYYTDKEQEIPVEYFEKNKEELIKKVKDLLKEKMNTDKFEFNFEINTLESPGQVIV